MTISPATIKLTDKPSRGDLAYVCARNLSQAHSLLVRAIRESGLSQKELANLTGIDEATISRTLSRPRNVELNTFSKLVFGACGALLEFSLLRPEDAGHKAIYLATKSISEQSSSIGRLFVYSDLSSGSSAKTIDITASNNGVPYDNIAFDDSSDMRILEIADA